MHSRRDGSPFMNLLQCSPLCDSQGRVKYFIGAQIDVSGLALDGAQMESLIELQSRYRDPDEESIAEMPEHKHKEEFQELCELFSPRELASVSENGGDLFQPMSVRSNARNGHRTWLQRGRSVDSEAEAIRLRDLKSPMLRGALAGVYENVCHTLFLFNYQTLTRKSTFLFAPTHLSKFSSHLLPFKSRACCNRHSFPELAAPPPSAKKSCRQ